MSTKGEDGYELWLRYRQVDDADLLAGYRRAVTRAAVIGSGTTAEIIRSELARALPALLGNPVPLSDTAPAGDALVGRYGHHLADLQGKVDPQRHEHVSRRLK